MDFLVIAFFGLIGWALGKLLASLIKTDRPGKTTYVYHNYHTTHTTHNHLHISKEDLQRLNNQ